MSSHYGSQHFRSTHFASSHFGNIEVIVVPIKRGGSSAGQPIPSVPQKHRVESVDDIEQLKLQIMREDDEIISVIIAAVRILNADT